MYTHLTEQLAGQRQAELQAELQARPPASRHSDRIRRAPRQHRHPIRRRTGYALVSIGLRLVYLAGED